MKCLDDTIDVATNHCYKDATFTFFIELIKVMQANSSTFNELRSKFGS